MLTSQLEAATDVCANLDEVRDGIAAMRAEAAEAAADHGATLLATSTHPTASISEIDVAERDRYARLLDRHAGLVGQLNLCGCHVHVSVPDLDTAIAIMNHARVYLPVLAALTGSSPFHEGGDTGFASVRLARLALWPQGGLPPLLGSAAQYQALVAQLIDTGIVDEPSELLWELRPSAHYPTLEFRIADMCPDIDDVVLLAGLVRSLVRTLADRSAPPIVPDPVLTAARWRAARFGLSGELWSTRENRLLPARDVVEQLWRDLEPDLLAHREDGVLRPLLDQLLERGTSATRQRQIYGETGSLTEVARDGIALTALARC